MEWNLLECIDLACLGKMSWTSKLILEFILGACQNDCTTFWIFTLPLLKIGSQAIKIMMVISIYLNMRDDVYCLQRRETWKRSFPFKAFSPEGYEEWEGKRKKVQWEWVVIFCHISVFIFFTHVSYCNLKWQMVINRTVVSWILYFLLIACNWGLLKQCR